MDMNNWYWKELKETVGFKKFKYDYIRLFNTHHPELLKKEKGYRQPRIYDDDKHEKQSILNYINTNVSAYTILVNETLRKINFNPLTEDGYDVMMDYNINQKIFWLDILPKITEKIKYTSSLGERKEKLVETKINDFFKIKGNYKIVSYGKLGDLTDMNSGIDMVISNDNGKRYTAQVKTCSSVNLDGDTFIMKYNGVNKLYGKIDYFICVVNESVYVFDNIFIEKHDDGYKCEKEVLKVIL
jgi:hypothetical protein